MRIILLGPDKPQILTISKSFGGEVVVLGDRGLSAGGTDAGAALAVALRRRVAGD